MLNDDVIVARLTELLKSLRKLPSYAQQLARQVGCCLVCRVPMQDVVIICGCHWNVLHKWC